MAKKIRLETLMSKLTESEISDKELAEYFMLDEQESGPFSPQLTINPDTVIIPDGLDGTYRSALALNSANFFSRIRRQSRFNRKISDGYKGPIIVSEGDSWFQYPLLLKDTIDWLMDDYAIYSLGAAGDLLQRMARKREYLTAIKETGASILLFSGGGNDLVAGGALADHLEQYDSQLDAADYLKASYQVILDDAFGHYERIFRDVKGAAPHVQIICHGYDYVVPDNGRWLGKPFAVRGIADHSLQRNIVREMMNRFNRGLLRLCATMPHVNYVNCRGTVHDNRWHDELHPTRDGYQSVAELFSKQIQKVQGKKVAPVFSIPGSFGRATSGAPSVVAYVGGERVPAAAHGSRALHIGLNQVDPNHYAGWDGRLRACENDALAMAHLSQELGYQHKVLLTRAATRDAVVAEIKKAAGALGAGDMFLMTVSAHGGKLPDLNNDEIDDGDDPQDETLLLYDFMIADDELYALWSEFSLGVRIVLIADTCHSGSMVRANPFGLMLNDGQDRPENEFRYAPRYVTTRTYFQHEREYKSRADQFSAIKEEIINNPLTTPVKASVLNLGACRDQQYARDGDEFGAFTGALLKIWNKGRFDGDYRSLMKQATTLIDSRDQTPTIKQVGTQDTAFLLQRPFAVWSAPPEYKPASPSTGTVIPDSKITDDAVLSQSSVELGSPVDYLNSEEDAEEDPVTVADLERLFDLDTANLGARSANAAATWPLYGEFKEFIDSLALAYFEPDEFLILGAKHGSLGDSCAGLNSFPPKSLWPNIVQTARILDTLRARLGKSVAVTNAYRAPPYNRCIGGVPASRHLRFNALDFAVKGMNPVDYVMELRTMRDSENLFQGGIGLYNSFVHLDTRGRNATWPRSFA